MTRLAAAVTLAMVAVAGSCSEERSTRIEVPANATFCDIYSGEYRRALGEAVPITDDRFTERAEAIAAWAGVLLDLAPAEILEQATSNLRYHEAQLDRVSAAEHIEGSNEMHAWAQANC